MTPRFARIVAVVAFLPIPLVAQDEQEAVDAPVAKATVEMRATPATPVPEASEPREIVEKFFATLGHGRVEAAYEQLTTGSKIAQNAGQSTLLRSKTVDAIAAFGQIKGHELVEMEWAGTHLVRLTYLSLGEFFPLRWRFYFYRRDQAWRLVDIRVDDRLKALFHEEAEEK